MAKLTLVIDGNFMVKRIAAVAGVTFLHNPDEDRKVLREKLIAHIASEIRKGSDFIDDVVITTDNRSWRKAVEVVRPIGSVIDEELSYKANRVSDSSVDWGKVFDTFAELCTELSANFGVKYTKVVGAEADDLIWAWSRHLSKLGRGTLIYCTDSDLNQLVNERTFVQRHIKSKNAPNGEVVFHRDWWSKWDRLNEEHSIFAVDTTKIEIFNKLINNRTIGAGVVSTNPVEQVFYKCVMGDPKDNVPPLFQWRSANNTQNRFIGLNHIWKAIEIIRPGMNLTHQLTHDHLYDEQFIREFIPSLFETTKQQNVDAEHTYKVFLSNRKMLYLSETEIPEKLQLSMNKTILESSANKGPAKITDLAKFDVIMNKLGVIKSGSIFDGFLGDLIN